MRKKRIFAIALLSVAACLAACGTQTGESSTAAPEAQSSGTETGASEGGEEATEGSSSGVKELQDMSWEEIEAKAQGQEVVFTTWHSEEQFTKICQDFTEKTGIKATLLVSDAEAVTNKLIAEKEMDKSSIDVVIVGGTNVKMTKDADIWEPGILNIMPDKAAYDEKLSTVQEGVTTDGDLVPIYRNQTGLLYNPEEVENPPQTLAELEQFIDENPNKFGFCDPTGGGSGQAMLMTLIKELCGGLDQYMEDQDGTVDPEKTAKWQAVWDWCNERKDKIVITTSNADSLMRLNQGELSLVVAWDDDSNASMKNGELFKEATFYIPDMGLAGGGDTLGIPKNSANKEASLLFINYITSKEVQEQMNLDTGRYPARTDVEVKNTLIPADDMVNSLAWYPAQYKQECNNEFVTNVLMQ